MAARRKKQDDTPQNPPAVIEGKIFYGLQFDSEQEAFANAIWSEDNDIIFVNANAGTGKTVISVGVANMLVQYGKFNEIIYIMSPYGERKQGWLPGTISEKSAVYFDALYHALINCNVNPHVAISSESLVSQKTGDGYITCITDTFLRGSTFEHAVIIIDEAQNYTVSQLKKTLTRVGKHVKVIVIGHDQQCDLPSPKLSGFVRYMEHFRGLERVAVCELSTNYRSWISAHADILEE